MRQKVCRAVKMIAFLAIGLVIFFYVQDVMTPDWSYEENINRTIDGFDQLEDNEIDVLFLGTSLVECGMSPMRLYEDTQIRSYSLATSGQTLECSYHLLKRAFETQTPSVVFLDASELFMAENVDRNAPWRYILDNLSLNKTKLKMAEDYSTLWYSDGKMAALFPMIKYHTRWSQIVADDFKRQEEINYYSAGGYVLSEVSGTHGTANDVDKTADALQRMTSGTIKYRENETIHQTELAWPLYTCEISDHDKDSLMKIIDLCKNNHSQLILFKIQTVLYPQFSLGSWTKVKSELTAELAAEYGIPFLDFQYDVDSRVDFTTDTIDGGNHQNIRGAEKNAVVIGKYLRKNYDIKAGADPLYDEALEKYQEVREIAFLQSETDFKTYLSRLYQNSDHLTVFISAREEYTSGMDDDTYALLEAMGFSLIREGGYTDVYVAVMNAGDVEYEAVSDRRINHETAVNGLPVKLNSSGWHTSSMCSIKINGQEYAINHRGLNIVVYDNETDLVLDSVCFDTFLAEKTAIRNNSRMHNFLRAYESRVAFGED